MEDLGQANVECLKELIAAGADINKEDNNGPNSFDGVLQRRSC